MMGRGFGTAMVSEETPQRDPEVNELATVDRPWQFSLWSLFAFTAAIALLLGIATVVPERAYCVVVVPVAAIAAFAHPSEMVRFLAVLMVVQFLGANLLAPGDGGFWVCTICRLYLGVDIFLFARLYFFYKIA